MSVRYCDDIKEALRTLIRIRKGKFPETTFIRYRCGYHHITHGVTERMILIGKRFYCDQATRIILGAQDKFFAHPITPAEFEKRLVPVERLPRLWRYIPPSHNGNKTS